MISKDWYNRKFVRTTMAGGGKFGMSLRYMPSVLMLSPRQNLPQRPAVRI